jgi:hypothetical protein
MQVCSICSLKQGHPGVIVGDNGMCNLCKLDIAQDLLHNFTYTRQVFDEFVSGASGARGEYDCLFMYSGGKDSTYMLDKFANEYGKRVVAYTFNVPFENSNVTENIRLARERIPADFVGDSDDDSIRLMMREVFNRPAKKPGKYLDEKLPCTSCRSFFVIRAILYAFRRRIPYIALCADPQQILTMESDTREIVRGFYRAFGVRLTNELFRDEIEEILFADAEDLPKIVFPFISMRYSYDPDLMVEELKAKGLYVSSPLETHCTLFPLLNYYSFKNWDCMFYKLNASAQKRAAARSARHERTTFSIKFPRAADLTGIEERLRRVVMEIAEGRGESSEHERELVGIFESLDAGADAARSVARSFLNMPEVAADMGIRL